MTDNELHIKKIAAYVPISTEELIDAGYPPPPGYAPWQPPKLSRWKRIQRRWYWARWNTRSWLGRTIAGPTWPGDDE